MYIASLIAYTTGVAHVSSFQTVGGTCSVPPVIIDVKIVGPPINPPVVLGHLAEALIFDKLPSLPCWEHIREQMFLACAHVDLCQVIKVPMPVLSKTH